MNFPLKDIDEMRVHLWCVPLDRFSTDHPDHLQCLSPEEKERAARFRFERDRKRYEISHGALRAILGSYLEREPHSVRFEICETGKPELLVAPGDPLITFNMSHSGDMMILGVTRNRRIGVDVEMMSRRIDMFHIAKHFFTAEENEGIREAPAEKRPEMFFSYWTGKEAYLKAIGCGLAQGAPTCITPGEDASWLSDSRCERPQGQWTLHSPRMPDGYIAAVVVDGEYLDFVQFEANRSCNILTEEAEIDQRTMNEAACKENSVAAD